MTLAERTAPIAPTPHRWTVDDFFRASEAGLFDGQRVELIEGELIDMPAQKDPHAFAISLAARELMRLFPEPYWVKIQATLRLNDFSGPEPDVAVMSGPPSPPALSTPVPLLIVEVSDTTLVYDRGDKASLYAANGITDYWVVNLNGRQIEVFRSPSRNKSRPFGWEFAAPDIFKIGDKIQPLAAPHLSLDVATLLR